jgi:hypothetical protein
VEKENMKRERDREREREREDGLLPKKSTWQACVEGELLPEKSAGKRNPRSHATAATDDKERRDGGPRIRATNKKRLLLQCRARFFFDFSRTL